MATSIEQSMLTDHFGISFNILRHDIINYLPLTHNYTPIQETMPNTNTLSYLNYSLSVHVTLSRFTFNFRYFAIYLAQRHDLRGTTLLKKMKIMKI